MEKWERWIPTKDIPSQIYKRLLLDQDGSLLLLFVDKDDKTKISVYFDGLVQCYRNRDEGRFLKKLTYLDENYPRGFYSKWPLLKVENSEYAKWYHLENFGAFEEVEKVEHFVFITPDDVIEVLSTFEPTITVKGCIV